MPTLQRIRLEIDFETSATNTDTLIFTSNDAEAEALPAGSHAIIREINGAGGNFKPEGIADLSAAFSVILEDVREGAGTLLGRLLHTYSFWNGRDCRLQFRGQTYLLRVEKVQYPATGVMTVRLVDRLRKYITKQFPEQTTIALTADITGSATAIAYDGGTLVAGTYYRMGDEAVLATDADTITRAQLGTSNAAHSSDEAVQEMVQYSGTHVLDIIRDIFTKIGVPSSYVDAAVWDNIKNNQLPQQTVSKWLIPSPKSVEDTINSLGTLAVVGIAYDPTSGTVVPYSLTPWENQSSIVLDDDLMSSPQLEVAEDVFATQIAMRFGSSSPIRDVETEWTTSYRSINASTESPFEYGTSKERVFYVPQLSVADSTLAKRAVDRLSLRYAKSDYPPVRLTVTVPLTIIGSCVPGTVFRVLSDKYSMRQGATGVQVPILMQVTERNIIPSANQIDLTLLEYLPSTLQTITDYIIASSTSNFNIYDHYLSPPQPISPTITLAAGVEVSSTLAGKAALTTGPLHPASAVTLILETGASIIGAGGKGGGGTHYGTVTYSSGGDAVYVDGCSLNLTNNGLIGGGGGGGSANYIGLDDGNVAQILGGGGGAGVTAGIGGLAGTYATGAPARNGEDGTRLLGGAGGVAGVFNGGAGGDLGEIGGLIPFPFGHSVPAYSSSSGGHGIYVGYGAGVTYATKGDIRGAAPA